MYGRGPSGSVKSINPWQSVMQTGEGLHHGLRGLPDGTDGVVRGYESISHLALVACQSRRFSTRLRSASPARRSELRQAWIVVRVR